jgi:hypothetical protein
MFGIKEDRARVKSKGTRVDGLIERAPRPTPLEWKKGGSPDE